MSACRRIGVEVSLLYRQNELTTQLKRFPGGTGPASSGDVLASPLRSSFAPKRLSSAFGLSPSTPRPRPSCTSLSPSSRGCFSGRFSSRVSLSCQLPSVAPAQEIPSSPSSPAAPAAAGLSRQQRWGSWTEREEGLFSLLPAKKRVERGSPSALRRRAAFLAASVTRGSMGAEDIQFACTEMAEKGLHPLASFWRDVEHHVVQRCYVEIPDAAPLSPSVSRVPGLPPSAAPAPDFLSASLSSAACFPASARAISLRQVLAEAERRADAEGASSAATGRHADGFVLCSSVPASSLLTLSSFCATLHAFARGGVSPLPLAPRLPSLLSPEAASPRTGGGLSRRQPPPLGVSSASASGAGGSVAATPQDPDALAGKIYAVGALLFSRVPLAFRGGDLALLTGALVKAGVKDKAFYVALLDFLLETPPAIPHSPFASPSPSPLPLSPGLASCASPYSPELPAAVSTSPSAASRPSALPPSGATASPPAAGARGSPCALPPVAPSAGCLSSDRASGGMVAFLDFEQRPLATLLYALASPPVSLPRAPLLRVFHLFADFLLGRGAAAPPAAAFASPLPPPAGGVAAAPRLPLHDLQLAALATVLRSFLKVRCDRSDLLEATRVVLEDAVLPSLATQAHGEDLGEPREAAAQAAQPAREDGEEAARSCGGRGLAAGSESLLFRAAVCTPRGMPVTQSLVIFFDVFAAQLAGVLAAPLTGVDERARILRGEAWGSSKQLQAKGKQPGGRTGPPRRNGASAAVGPHALDSGGDAPDLCDAQRGAQEQLLVKLATVLQPRVPQMELGGVMTLCFALSRVAHLQDDLDFLISAIARRARLAMTRAAGSSSFSGAGKGDAEAADSRTAPHELVQDNETNTTCFGAPDGAATRTGAAAEDALTCRDVSNLAQTFARLNFEDAEFLRALDAWIPSHAALFAPQDLVGILYAYRQLRHVPEERVREAVFRALFTATERLIPSFTLQQLVTVLSSFSRMQGAALFPGAQETFFAVCNHLVEASSLRFHMSSAPGEPRTRASPSAPPSLSARDPVFRASAAQRQRQRQGDEGKKRRGQREHGRVAPAGLELTSLRLVPIVGALGRMRVRHEPFFEAAGNFFCADGLERAFAWDLQSLKDAYSRVGLGHPKLLALIDKHLSSLPPVPATPRPQGCTLD
ncbi:hypothetical protein BESB_008720 [Besnoitia besnoiti]|uniref:RAP domain-containing protein n=1 Tax=Besnoitia besnoiti TaxID=94643 RepID=A0A2A9MQU2_BESBE|nr:hypothetical protein BESB_008720 [Besnoitia besnoiti]PFH38530.1 hypothetical protein BESB_008720 [Besnoitia besnoiti]